MQIRFLCPRWGSEALSWNSFIQKVKGAGYDGIECGLPAGTSHAWIEDVFEECASQGLMFIPQHWDTYESNFQQHRKTYAHWFSVVETIRPAFINSQTGKDFFTQQQNAEIIGIADEFTKRTGVPVYHETHRNKFSFACHVTRQYLDAMPSLKITLDASHWVNVAESFLEDQADNMNAAIQRTAHIHARIGHTQGPQVTDPHQPEWEQALWHHLQWWDAVVRRKRALKAPTLTITPEFGPAPYMVQMPGTRVPIADQWAINESMMNLLKERYRK